MPLIDTLQNGLIVVDKPAGFTSFDVIGKIRRILGIKKIGHAGTLDKFATGVLLIFTGQATRLARFYLEHDKCYEGLVVLGSQTDTLDPEGEIVMNMTVPPITADHLAELEKKFTGELMQIPPRYSALKKNGVRFSDLARKGHDIEPEARKIWIRSLKLSLKSDNEMQLRVECSKGTYVRSLARDLSETLETCGYLGELRRITLGNYSIKEAITLDELASFANDGKSDKKFFYTLEEATSWMNTLEVCDEALFKLKNGAQFDRNFVVHEELHDTENLYRIVDKNKNLIAIVNIDIDNWVIDYLNVYN